MALIRVFNRSKCDSVVVDKMVLLHINQFSVNMVGKPTSFTGNKND